MKFTDKDLLKAMGLEVGDFVLTKDMQWEVTKHVEGLKIWSDDYMGYEGLEYLIGLEFEKVEQKIWTSEQIKNGDIIWFIESGNNIKNYSFDAGWHSYGFIDASITFTKRKYAEEYLEELKKFNKDYKKNNL